MLKKKRYCISLQKYSLHMVSICTIYKSHYLMVFLPNHHETDFIPQNDTTSWDRAGTSKLLYKSLPEYNNSLTYAQFINTPSSKMGNSHCCKCYVRAIYALLYSRLNRPPLTNSINIHYNAVQLRIWAAAV